MALADKAGGGGFADTAAGAGDEDDFRSLLSVHGWGSRIRGSEVFGSFGTEHEREEGEDGKQNSEAVHEGLYGQVPAGRWAWRCLSRWKPC